MIRVNPDLAAILGWELEWAGTPFPDAWQPLPASAVRRVADEVVVELPIDTTPRFLRLRIH